MAHEHAEVWEKLPTETLEFERDRIAEALADLLSRSETIKQIIEARAE